MGALAWLPSPPNGDDIKGEAAKIINLAQWTATRAGGEAAANGALGGAYAVGEETAAVAAALDTIFVVTIALALVAVLNVVWIGLYFLWQLLKDTPLVGGWVSYAASGPLVWLGLIISSLDAFIGAAFMRLMFAVQALLDILTPAIGIPRTRHVHAIVNTSNAQIMPLIKHIDATVTEVQKELQSGAAHISGHTHALWSRLTNLERWTHITTAALHAVQVSNGRAWDAIKHIQHAVKVLQADMVRVFHTLRDIQRELQHQQAEITRLQHRVSTLERQMTEVQTFVSPVGEVAAGFSLLSPLLATGAEGVANLSKVAEDPCICNKNPNLSGCFVDDLLGMAKHLTPL